MSSNMPTPRHGASAPVERGLGDCRFSVASTKRLIRSQTESFTMLRKRRRGQRRDRQGVAVVEFALVMLLLVALLAGIWETGRMIDVHQLVHNACREAARQAAAESYGF